MRHQRRGRQLGRNSSHRKAMLKNLASSLILTERDAELDDNAPKVKGRVITTLQKAKEVRPLVEKCVTIARRSLKNVELARTLESGAERGTAAWKEWRNGEGWQKWCAAAAPVVHARRQVLKLIGDKEAVQLLFDEIAPRFAERPGGYTRILRLAKPRLGDAGTRAILEFVGQNDRVTASSDRPEFAVDDEPASAGDAKQSGPVGDDDAGNEPSQSASADPDATVADSESDAGNDETQQ